MARFRLSGPAKADLARILAASVARWGAPSRRRYAALLATAMRRIAADPTEPTTADRRELHPRLRSFHIRHARAGEGVKNPVHVLYYREAAPGLIEIVRVLHERMEPSRHMGS